MRGKSAGKVMVSFRLIKILYRCLPTEVFFEFDSNFHIIREKKFPVGVRAHGVCYNKRLNCFYIACSYLDAVLVLDEEFTIQDEIKISNKYSSNSEPHHHINDCWTDGYSLYVSMFSLTGNWKKEVYDGGVLEFDLESKSCNGAVMQNLWMPHNISFVDGCLTILDSFPVTCGVIIVKLLGNFQLLQEVLLTTAYIITLAKVRTEISAKISVFH